MSNSGIIEPNPTILKLKTETSFGNIPRPKDGLFMLYREGQFGPAGADEAHQGD